MRVRRLMPYPGNTDRYSPERSGHSRLMRWRIVRAKRQLAGFVPSAKRL
jgi:hypothetical protein